MSGNFVHGKFTPKNPAKYIGKFPILFRSSWEWKLMRYFDFQPAVVKWNSESLIITYMDPTRNNTMHRYIVDFTCTIKDKNGNMQNYIVEVKPHSQSVMPIKGRKAHHTYVNECIIYARNVAKWKFASEYASKKGAKFIVLTEKDLFL